MRDYTNPQLILDGSYTLEDIKHDVDYFAQNFKFYTLDIQGTRHELGDDFFAHVDATFGHLDPDISDSLNNAARACILKLYDIIVEEGELNSENVVGFCDLITGEYSLNNTRRNYNHYFDGYIHPDIEFVISLDIENTAVIITGLHFPLDLPSTNNPRYESKNPLYSRHIKYDGPLVPTLTLGSHTQSPKINATNKNIINGVNIISHYLDHGNNISFETNYLISVDISYDNEGPRTYTFSFTTEARADKVMRDIIRNMEDKTPVIIADEVLNKTHIFNSHSIISVDYETATTILDARENILEYIKNLG